MPGAKYQSSQPCPECGSMYRRADHHCSRCGIYAPDPPDKLPKHDRTGFPPAGRIWSKRLGKYVGQA